MADEKIILFGGTFDPIHRGHIQVARAAMEWIGARQVIFIPARRSPHKKQQPIAPDSDRMEMIRLAIAGRSAFSVSDCELRRPQPSYTIDTVLDFLARCGPGTEWIWLIGADAIKDLPRWYRIGDLMSAAVIAVMCRAGYPKPDFTACKPDFTPAQIQKLEQNIVPVPLIDISSTDIRARLAAGQDADDLLTPEVADYIRARRLYR